MRSLRLWQRLPGRVEPRAGRPGLRLLRSVRVGTHRFSRGLRKRGFIEARCGHDSRGPDEDVEGCVWGHWNVSWTHRGTRGPKWQRAVCCCRCATAVLLMLLLDGCSSCSRCAAAGVVDVLLVVLSLPFFLQLARARGPAHEVPRTKRFEDPCRLLGRQTLH